MDVLWDSTEPLTVRQVGLRLTNRDLAHTTVMTVLDRLAKKGFARRQRDGRAWRYRAAANREAYVTELMLHALDQTGDRSAALASSPGTDRTCFSSYLFSPPSPGARPWARLPWRPRAGRTAHPARPSCSGRRSG